MARSTEYLLSVIRGLLGFVVAIQLFVVAYLIQTSLQDFIQAVGSIPAGFIPILNALQITVVLTIAAAGLLIAGLFVRLTARRDDRRSEGATEVEEERNG